MELTKIFGTDGTLSDLEAKINEWLMSQGGNIEIVRVLQTQSGTEYDNYVVITFFYKKV